MNKIQDYDAVDVIVLVASPKPIARLSRSLSVQPSTIDGALRMNVPPAGNG